MNLLDYGAVAVPAGIVDQRLRSRPALGRDTGRTRAQGRAPAAPA